MKRSFSLLARRLLVVGCFLDGPMSIANELRRAATGEPEPQVSWTFERSYRNVTFVKGH